MGVENAGLRRQQPGDRTDGRLEFGDLGLVDPAQAVDAVCVGLLVDTLEGLDNRSDLVIDVLHLSCENFHLFSVKSLFFIA